MRPTTIRGLALGAALAAAACTDGIQGAAAPAKPTAAVAEAKVRPGLVAWRADADAAFAAARTSGKPVLLFQMLGRLDDEFC